MTPGSWTCPIPLRDHPNIVMGHGGGGKLSSELIRHLILPAFDDEELDVLADAAVLDAGSGRIAFSTDSFVVQPRFFPGGNIGHLAVHGTVNDLAMRGAIPRFLSVGFVLEEGLALEELGLIVQSMADSAKRAGVRLVTGDTKVVDRGHGDGVYINTTGVGSVPDGIDINPRLAAVGDSVLVSGTIGDHGMAVMSVREGIGFEADILSDTAPLSAMVADLVASGIDLHVLRDPTRGGLASALVEIASAAGVGIEIEETSVPVRPLVAAACEMLGMDPMYVANEGKLVAFVPESDAAQACEIMRRHPEGADATIIGSVVAEHPGIVAARTPLGTMRVVDTHVGEQLPRIC